MNKQKIAKTNALGQIFLLVVAVFAFAWLLGGFGGVSAGNEVSCSGTGIMKAGSTGYPQGTKISYSGVCRKTFDCMNLINSGSAKDSIPDSNCRNLGPTYGCCATSVTKLPNSNKNAQDKNGNVLKTTTLPVVSSVATKVATNALFGSTTEGAGAGGGAGSGPGFFSGIFSKSGSYFSHITAGAAIAVGFSYLGQILGGSADSKDILGGVLGGGATTAYLLLFTAANPFLAAGIGAVVLVANLFMSHTKEQGVVYYYCQPWDAKTKGEDCHLCNEQNGVPCSEYQCKSLGQSCEFVQSDNQTGDSFCFWNNRNDVTPPVITPNLEVLSNGYKYAPTNAVSTSERGAKIFNKKSNDGCLSPFTQVTFGITSDEPAKCKIDFQRKDSYDLMSQYIGGSQTRKFNHTQTIVIPELNQSLGKDNSVLAFVRCQDSNGYANIHDFVFEMCVQKGPDTTPPIIYGTSISNGAKVPFNVTEANVDFYVNEPATCKWDFSDKKYDDLNYNMSCATNASQMNLRMSYTCSTNLTGIKRTESTDYFVRCRDQPNKENATKNTNAQSYKYSLSSSRALVITSVSPNNTEIKDSTTPGKITLQVKTIGGAYDGKAVCSSSPTGNDGDYTFFDNTGDTTTHTTEVYLNNGNYDYYVKCDDKGGNSDTEKISFNVSIDTTPPLVARAYYDAGNLKLITNEKAECRYSVSSCNYAFEEGVLMSSTNSLTHIVDWDPDVESYKIKCQDIYGNEPASQNECSIIVKTQS